MTINRKDVPRPSLPQETIDIPELGGEVVVRGLLLKDSLRLSTEVGFGRMSDMLSVTVVDAENEPIFTVDEWEIFGAQHTAAAFKLFDVASRLSGMGGEEKKEPAQG